MSLKELIRSLKSNKLVTPKIDQHLLQSGRTGVGDGWIHPSRLTACIRAQVLNCLKFPFTESIPARIQRVFDNGNDMHLRYQGYLKKIGALELCDSCAGKGCRECRQSGVEVNFEWIDLMTRGQADGLFKEGFLGNIDAPVLELKSMKQELFQALGGPKADHLLQAHVYMHAFHKKRCIFIYENKNDQTMKEFVVVWDEEIWKNALSIINKVMSHAKKHELPAGTCTPDKFSEDCKFRNSCMLAWKEGKWPKDSSQT